MTSRAEAMVGCTIAGGAYQIVRLLGEGGMGAVYQARQVAMDRMVALKLIRPDLGQAEQAARRFEHEMRLSARVEHPNTIRVYDFGVAEGGQLYLAMELLTGVPLTALIEHGPLGLERIVHIARQVAKALGAMHERGVVHRDLKPDNVMLMDSFGEPDFVKVLDFGVARSLEEHHPRITATGSLIGTPAYMSPEQGMGRAVDGRSDLYSLGVMLYLMASGRIPFDKVTTGSMLLAHETERPVPVAEVAPGTSPSLARLIMQLLEKEPELRPQTAAEVVAALDACLAPAAEPTGDTRARRRRARGRRPLVATLAVAVAAAGVAAAVALGRGGSGAPAGRGELDAWLARAGAPPAPERCRARDPADIARLLAAARAPGAPAAAPTTAEGWALRARAQLAADARQALASAQEAVRLCPGYALAHDLAGNALQKLGRLDEAEDAYVRALGTAPSYDAPRFNLGLLQLRRHDASAAATFTELLRRRPDYPNAHLVRAQAYLLQGRVDDALADLETAVRQAPDSADAWLALASLRERLGRGDAAAAYCRAKALGSLEAAGRCR